MKNMCNDRVALVLSRQTCHMAGPIPLLTEFGIDWKVELDKRITIEARKSGTIA